MSSASTTPFLNFQYSAPFHLLSYACLLGMTIWHSFVSSTMARKILTRDYLGALQGKLFPIYFFLQTALSSVCLLTTSNRNGQIIFIIGFLGGFINLISFGPQTTKLMIERLKLEREEGKKYNEIGISDQFKSLNKQFRIAHGCSVLANLVITILFIAYPFIVPPMIA